MTFVKEGGQPKTIKFIYKEIICRHGCPQRILTDRGTHFKNKLIEGLTKKFEITHLLSTPYHPQTNGLVECFNRTLCEALAKLTEKEKNWDDHIAPVLFAYRTSQHSTTKVTPFLLTHGCEATLPMDDPIKFVEQVKGDPLYKRYTEILQDLPNVQQGVQTRVTRQRLQQKQRHDAKIKK